MPRARRILVVLTGEPVAKVQADRGTFDELFYSAMPNRHLGSRLQRALWRVTEGEKAPAPDEFDGVIVTGSPAMISDGDPWIQEATRFVRETVKADVPLLAVCFGHQLLAHAMGGDVGPNPWGRLMGTVRVTREAKSDVLFADAPMVFSAQVSHRDVILKPGPNLEVIGHAEHDPHHMVKAGPRAWGVQFHPEFDLDIVRDYLHARRSIMEEEGGSGTTDRLLGATSAAPHAHELIRAFSALCVPKAPKKPRAPKRPAPAAAATWRHLDPESVATQKHLTLPDGTRIQVRLFHEKGATGVPLILNDGLGCEGYIWRYVIDRLKANHPILHWQYRGHGSSDVPKDLSTIKVDQLVDDLTWLLDEVGVKDGVFFGHSMGVQVVLEAHRRLAERMRGLVLLCGSYGRPIETWHGPDNPRRKGPLSNRGMRRIFPWLSGAFINLPGVMQPIWKRMIPTELSYQIAVRFELNPKRVNREDFFPYLKHLGDMDMRVFAQLARSLAEHSAAPLLADIATPTLIVAGGRDTFTPAWLSETMHHRIAGSEYLFLPDGSHTAPIEHPELIHHRVVAFLEKKVPDEPDQ